MSSSSRPSPDPNRLAMARGVAKGYFERKKKWSRALFVIAAVAEFGLFGAMLFFFDFSSRLYWFLFFGVSFVYSPLITFIVRNSVMIDRLYYRLILDLKFDASSEDGCSDDAEKNRADEENGERSEAQTFLIKKSRWATVLFVMASVFEGGLFVALLYFMDFSSQLHWFMLFGFLGVYTPLILSAWRNTFSIDRVYYGLVDELKYRRR